MEVHARYERFRTELGHAGYTEQQLTSFFGDMQRFYAEFTKQEAEAQRLAEAGRPVAGWRLAAIQHELGQSLAELQGPDLPRKAYQSTFVQALTGARERAEQAPAVPADLAFGPVDKEADLLRQIEEIYQEFCRAGQAFGALCSQYSYGPPAAILEEHWRELEELDTRFAELEDDATLLAAGDRRAARQRLSLVRADLVGTIAIVKKMHAARSVAEATASEPEGQFDQGFAERMLEMSKRLRKSRDDKSDE